MSRPPRNPLIPTLNGVTPSVVALPCQPPGQTPWTTVADYLAWRLPAVSLQQWCERMASGAVLTVDGQTLPPETPFRAGMRVHYWRAQPDEPAAPGPVHILFRDDHLLVADKPHFMPVTPSGAYVQRSLLVQLKRLTGVDTLSPIHRIDRETAGLVVFSCRPQDRDAYQALFRKRQVHKRYEAIAPTGTSPLPAVRHSRIVEDPDAFFRMREVEGEPNSQTWLSAGESRRGLTRYALEPVSGRRHQLRVHLWGLGRPICGDSFYPVVLRGPGEPDDRSQPLRLLAAEMAFTDPVTGQQRHFATSASLSWPDGAGA